VGFALLIPAVRTAMYKAIRARVNIQTFDTGQPPGPQRTQRHGDVIDADYHEVDPDEVRPSRPSGWTKH
jgi:UPF0716 protein FxsA